jgi:hypothetical protein
LLARSDIFKKQRAGLNDSKVAARLAICVGHPASVDGATSRRIVDAERGGHRAILNRMDNP